MKHTYTNINACMHAIANRFCPFCDLAQEDNVKHLVLQCPRFHQERADLFEALRAIPGDIGRTVLNIEDDILSILLGRHANNFTIEQMGSIWLVSCKHIVQMYRKNLKLKAGIG